MTVLPGAEDKVTMLAWLHPLTKADTLQYFLRYGGREAASALAPMLRDDEEQHLNPALVLEAEADSDEQSTGATPATPPPPRRRVPITWLRLAQAAKALGQWHCGE
jgi:hypothetical protein